MEKNIQIVPCKLTWKRLLSVFQVCKKHHVWLLIAINQLHSRMFIACWCLTSFPHTVLILYYYILYYFCDHWVHLYVSLSSLIAVADSAFAMIRHYGVMTIRCDIYNTLFMCFYCLFPKRLLGFAVADIKYDSYMMEQENLTNAPFSPRQLVI